MPDASGAISNGPTRETLYEFIDRETKINESIEDAQYTVRVLKKSKKDLRALIVASGITLDVFDEMRKKMALSFKEREAQDSELRRYMAWMGMPLGTQQEMFSEEETAVPPDIQISRVHDAGRTAGKLGRERAENPWKPGELLFAEWDSAWLAGKEEAAQSTTSAAPKRGPGRPKKTEAAAPAKPAAGLRKGKGKNKESRTAPPADPVFAQEPAAQTEAPAAPDGRIGLDFDSETAGEA